MNKEESMKTAKIGLLGFGNVGGGTYHILTENKKIIEERTGVTPEFSSAAETKSVLQTQTRRF